MPCTSIRMIAQPELAMEPRDVALVAHDNKKDDLLEWALYNRGFLAQHRLVGTGTTGSLLAERLDLPVECLYSGSLGGDQQMGARITEAAIDLLLFFWDPLQAQPHDTDVKALLRIAMVWNVPVACNRASADLIVSSPLWSQSYDRQVPRYDLHPSDYGTRAAQPFASQ